MGNVYHRFILIIGELLLTHSPIVHELGSFDLRLVALGGGRRVWLFRVRVAGRFKGYGLLSISPLRTRV